MKDGYHCIRIDLFARMAEIVFALDPKCRAQDSAASGELSRALINDRFAKEIELVDFQQKTINQQVTELAKYKTELTDKKQVDFKNELLIRLLSPSQSA